VPGSITTRPSGFSASEAILAISFEDPAPTDAVSPVASVMRALRPMAMSSTSGVASMRAATSMKASSMLTGSTIGDSSYIRAMTTSLYAWYAPKRGTR